MILGTYKDKSGVPVKIRTPEKKDLDKLTDYINSFVDERAYISVDKKISKKEEKVWLEGTLHNIKSKRGLYIMAERSGKLAGTADIRIGFGRLSHVAEVGISVFKDFRDLGIGKILMGEMIKQSKKLGIKVLKLGVFPQNKTAIKMYKKFGFKKYAALPKGLKFGGKFFDDILMYKHI